MSARTQVRSTIALALVVAAAACATQGPRQYAGGSLIASPGGFASASPAPKIFATNANGTSVTVYAKNANGNVAPLRTIQGPDTDLHAPTGIAVDSLGYIYVDNIGNTPADVDVYRPSANGDAKPVRKLDPASPNPTLGGARGMAFDSSNDLYIAVPAFGILEYAPGAKGNVAPVADIAGSNVVCSNPTAVDIDSGGNVWAASSASICEYAPGSNGNVTPTTVISGGMTQLFNVLDLKVSASGSIFVCPASLGSPLLRFAPGASGNVAPAATVAMPTSVATPFPASVALLGTQVYVGVGSAQSTLADAIASWPQTANGSPAPKRLIAGSKTGINELSYIAIH